MRKCLVSDECKRENREMLQKNLLVLRARLAISQEEMANLIGVSRQTYYGLETGKNEMSWTIYSALMFFFCEVQATREIIDGLDIYPHKLFSHINKMEKNDGFSR